MHGTLRGYVAIARCRLLSLRAAISKYDRALALTQANALTERKYKYSKSS